MLALYKLKILSRPLRGVRCFILTPLYKCRAKQTKYYHRLQQRSAMDWHFLFLGLLQGFAFLFTKEASALPGLLNQGHLVFVQNSKCIYSYEVAVHTARGSKSTESDGYQLHALVSKFMLNNLGLVIKKIYTRRRKKMSVWNIRPRKQDYLFRRSVALGKFHRNDPKSRVHLLCNRNCPKLFVNGEPPLRHPAWPQYMQRSQYIPAPYTFKVAILSQIQFMIC